MITQIRRSGVLSAAQLQGRRRSRSKTGRMATEVGYTHAMTSQANILSPTPTGCKKHGYGTVPASP